MQPILSTNRAAAGNLGLRISALEFFQVQKLVQDETGINLRNGKHELVCSRLAPRLRALHLSSLGDYLAHLRDSDPDGTEKRHLINAITTNKTSFFREAQHFDILAEYLLSPMAKAAPQASARRLRIWSAACSSGEEPYSIAMVLRETLPDLASWDARILASDIDTQMLATGEAAIYPLERTQKDLGDRRLREHCLAGQGSLRRQVRIRDELRRLVAFRRVNFRDETWPVRAQFDAIFCRNALIYFDLPMQRRVVSRLLAFLRPGGVLFLGHSESMLGQAPELKTIGHTAYRKVAP